MCPLIRSSSSACNSPLKRKVGPSTEVRSVAESYGLPMNSPPGLSRRLAVRPSMQANAARDRLHSACGAGGTSITERQHLDERVGCAMEVHRMRRRGSNITRCLLPRPESCAQPCTSFLRPRMLHERPIARDFELAPRKGLLSEPAQLLRRATGRIGLGPAGPDLDGRLDLAADEAPL